MASCNDRLRARLRALIALPTVFLLAQCGSDDSQPTGAPPISGVGVHLEGNTIHLAFSTEAGNDVMDLSGTKITGFSLLDSGVTSGKGSDASKDQLACGFDPRTPPPCDCTAEQPQFQEMCFYTDEALTVWSGKHETSPPADSFAMKAAYNVPLPTKIPKDEPASFFMNGAYPSLANFWFTARVTFRIADSAGNTAYVTCQDMSFAQTSNDNVNGPNFTNSVEQMIPFVAPDVAGLLVDPTSPIAWVAMSVDLGEFLDNLLTFAFDADDFWFLAAPNSAGYATATSPKGNSAPTLTFKCPATNDHYYAVRVGSNAIVDKKLNDSDYQIFAIRLMQDEWTEDDDVQCTNHGTSVTCDSEHLPSLRSGSS